MWHKSLPISYHVENNKLNQGHAGIMLKTQKERHFENDFILCDFFNI